MPRKKKKYLLVDGYNVINSWEELVEAMKISLEAARDKLIDYLSEYQRLTDEKVILIFDAHQLKGAKRSIENIKGLEVIYTMELETADTYIERRLDDIGQKEIVRVASSDGMIQKIILGRGGTRISSKELFHIIQNAKSNAKRSQEKKRNFRDKDLVSVDDEQKKLLDKLIRDMDKKTDSGKKRSFK